MRIKTILTCAAVALMLTMADSVWAQAPAADPAVGVLVSYDTHAGGILGLSGEIDASFDGYPISVVGHFGHGPTGVKGAIGPRLSKDFGPYRILGHYLYGSAGIGSASMQTALHKVGGALDIDVGKRAFLRIGTDADTGDMGTAFSGVVGVGVRF